MIPKMPNGHEWPMEGEDKIAEFNRSVFNPVEFLTPIEFDGHVFEIGIPAVVTMERVCVGVRVDGDYIHPFYRSTGTCTPEVSPEGTWWPFSGMSSGIWLGKYFWDPESQEWISHNKRKENLPDHLLHFCDSLDYSLLDGLKELKEVNTPTSLAESLASDDSLLEG